MLHLPLLILPFQLLLVGLVTLHFSHGTLVKQLVHCAIDLWAEVVVILEELELAQGVSAEWSGGGEGGCLEGFDILMGISIYHPIHQGVFTVLEFDVPCWFEFATWQVNVEGDVVSSLVQLVAQWDLRSWSIIFPSSPLVNLWPFVGCPSSAICSW